MRRQHERPRHLLPARYLLQGGRAMSAGGWHDRTVMAGAWWGIEPQDVRARVYSPLIVHRTVRMPPKQPWIVSHEVVGWRVAGFETCADACAAAKEIVAEAERRGVDLSPESGRPYDVAQALLQAGVEEIVLANGGAIGRTDMGPDYYEAIGPSLTDAALASTREEG